MAQNYLSTTRRGKFARTRDYNVSKQFDAIKKMMGSSNKVTRVSARVVKRMYGERRNIGMTYPINRCSGVKGEREEGEW